ncbi:MAG: ABC transporter ATP-binding protein, partial [Burkholderia contaminans]
MERDMPMHPAPSSAPLCEIDGLKVGFRGHDGTVTDAVRDLSLTLAPGERLGIVGESGS